MRCHSTCDDSQAQECSYQERPQRCSYPGTALSGWRVNRYFVPDPEDEAIRDLTRARNDARLAERKAKQRVISFLLRHNFVYPGKKPWMK